MKVSALIPTHNYAGYVRAAVESVLGQDYAEDVECIVIDDGSTDDTEGALALVRDRIIYLRQENRGMAAALNAGFSRAGGDVVCFLDADDLWKPHKVSRVVAAFQRDPGLGMVHHAVALVDGEGRELPFALGKHARADGDVSEVMRRGVLPWMFEHTSAISLRRHVADLVFPLLTGLRGNADDLLAPSAALLAPVRHLPEVLSHYRVHGTNLWASPSRFSKGEGATRSRVNEPAVSGALEDVDRLEDRQRYVRLAEEKVKQANAALSRAGKPSGLSPWLEWRYVRYRAQLEGKRPLAYLPDVTSAVWQEPVCGLAWKIGRVFSIARRMAKL